MARPPKKGLEFFYKTTGYYDDFKIIDLLNEYGPLGQTVYDVILTIIYKQGYYIELSVDKLAALVVRTIGNRWAKKNAVSQVIRYCAEIGLFDAALLEQNIVTSVGIQRRYSEVTARNKVNKNRYWLLDKTTQPCETATEMPVSATEMPVSATEMPVSATEMRQRKEKEIKDLSISDAFVEIARQFELVFGKLIGGMDREILMEISEYYPVDLVIEAMKIAKSRRANSARYVRSILVRMKEEGIESLEDLKRSNECQSGAGRRNNKPTDYSDLSRYKEMMAKYGGGDVDGTGNE